MPAMAVLETAMLMQYMIPDQVLFLFKYFTEKAYVLMYGLMTLVLQSVI